jgi:MFS family permease
MELPSGALADLLGRRTSLNLSFVVGSLSFMLFPFAREFWHFMLLAALIGLSDSFRSGSEEALVYDSFDKSDTDGFDKLYSRGNLIYQYGLIAGTLTGGVLYEIDKFIPFILYGISLFLGFLATFFYYEPKIDSEKFTLKNYFKQIKRGVRESFKDKKTTYTSLYYIAVGGITWTNALYFASFFIIGLGFGDAQRGFIQGGVRLLNAIGITYVLSKVKLSDRTRIIFFPIVMLIGFLPGAFVSGWGGIPFLELAMLSGTARWIFLTPITNKAFESRVRATAISTLSLLIGIVYIIIVGISGPVIQKYNIGTMYSVLGVITLFTVVPLSIKLLRVTKSGETVSNPKGSEAISSIVNEGEIG